MKKNIENSFRMEKELVNENLENVLGGTAASKISLTISMAPTTLTAKASKKTDSDSDDSDETTLLEQK